jgi:hypothetical protein
LTASSTLSVGVPLTANFRAETFRTLSGMVRVSECPAALCSVSGATTHTSLDNDRAIFSRTFSPGA